jgi:hypothetical protein
MANYVGKPPLAIVFQPFSFIHALKTVVKVIAGTQQILVLRRWW